MNGEGLQVQPIYFAAVHFWSIGFEFASAHTRTARPWARKMGAAICCNFTTIRTFSTKGNAAGLPVVSLSQR
jgi:hypothetical protein